MNILLWAERRKLRRSKIVWIAVFATTMVAVIVFAQGQFSFDGVKYINVAGWYMEAAQSLGTFFVLPAVIALLGGYIICREEQEDTLKSLKIIPVNEIQLTIAKMIVSLIFSVIIYLFLFILTLVSEIILHYEDLTFNIVFGFLKMYFLGGVCVFLAIAPIIALTARIKKGYWLTLIFAVIYSFAGLFASLVGVLGAAYPIVAVFNVSGYYDNATGAEVIISILSLLACIAIALFVLLPLAGKNESIIV
jgi:hypothetical protein